MLEGAKMTPERLVSQLGEWRKEKWILLAQVGGGCSVWVGMRCCLVHNEHNGCPGHDIQRSI